ncbi:MAG: phosphate ABC transporter substrate-binding protein PstS family protein [Gemmatimonas sp.]|nr:phosphate ABC transporter substrate-binding protein PstS family protein [Gemmatimonas sp.]
MVIAAILAGCGNTGDSAGGVAGPIGVDGSSTVFPITEAVAEEFIAETRGEVRVTVALSGTGGGFRRFCGGETDISNASRPISQTEIDACASAGIGYVELPVAYDGLAVLANLGNDFVECLTVDELRQIWAPGSTVQSWSQVRPEWPDQPLRLYGPGTNSGTFDYFTEEITGEAGASRSDYTASEDDNVLVQGVSGDGNALGYFGFAYYAENRDRLKLVAVDSGSGCVEPTPETIESGQYAPLSRPLMIYVKESALESPAVQSFVQFYLDVAPQLVAEVGYVPLEANGYDEARARLAQALDG